APSRPATPPSVLLVTVDTLRADRVGAYGDALARTPHADALARDGVLFEAAYSPAPITLPAHASILTGLLPPAHGVRGNGAFALPDPYRGEVASADAAVGVLLAAWDARPGPSVVAFTADHGEAFGEHREESHSLFVYDTTLHVPLMLRAPGLRPGRRIKEAVGLTDLAATLLDLAGGAGPTVP